MDSGLAAARCPGMTSHEPPRMSHPAASTEGLTKHFGATVALDGVDFDVAAGEIHAVVGENGAGKSTLIRILGGVWRPDRGTVRVDGAARHFSSPRDAIAAAEPKRIRPIDATRTMDVIRADIWKAVESLLATDEHR